MQTAEETRVDFSKQQRREQRARWPESITYPWVDGYFAKKKDIDEVVALKRHPITKLRADADCRFLYTGPHPQRRGARRKDEGKVNFQDLHRFEELGTLEERTPIHLYTATVWHVALKRTLRAVVLVNRKDPAKPRYIVLASTARELDGRKLVEYYGARFQIEFLFRDSNQFTGLADCQSRAAPGLDFHFNAALATLNLARAEELRTQPDLLPHVFSMASCNQRQFNERLLDVFIDNLALDPTWVKNHPAYENLRTDGAIAA